MSTQIKFILNEEVVTTNTPSGRTLLDFIRNEAKLTGTKEGCREGDCGACTVLLGELVGDHVHYKTINSCLYPIGKVNGKHVVTIEGISSDQLTPVQNAYVSENASQCGFCTPGFIISTTGYLLENEALNFESAVESISGNICRCTGYKSIERAVKTINDEIRDVKKEMNHFSSLVKKNIIPEYFISISNRLKELKKNKSIEAKSAMFIGGGTDLYVQKEDELKNSNPVFITDSSLPKIWEERDRLFISGSTTFEEFANSENIQKIIPDIKIINKLIASLPIRNSATIAGNIVNASPIGDMTIILLALNTIVHLSEDGRNRQVPLRQFFKGYKTIDKTSTEIINVFEIEFPKESTFFAFEKISKRTHLDIASVNSAISITVNDDQIISCGLSFGGVAPIPLFLENTSSYLEGKELSEEVLNESLKLIDEEISPISDVRGSTEYKRLLAKQIFKSHFMKLFPHKISMESFK